MKMIEMMNAYVAMGGEQTADRNSAGRRVPWR